MGAATKGETMADRMAWRFDGNLSHDLRSPRALEHIAYYLDRIDRHLERIADTFSRDEPNDVTALKALADIAETLKTKS
jgi:hypothetical protein